MSNSRRKRGAASGAEPAPKGNERVATFAGAAAASVLCFLAFQFLINPVCAYDAQQPVFFTTAEFFATHLTSAGGLSEYLGLLLSQAWYFDPLGSIVSAFVIFLCLFCFSLLLSRLSLRFRPVLSLLPALPLLWMHCSYYHPMKIDIALIFTLLGSIGYAALHSLSRIRRLSAWLLGLLLVFYAAGSLGMALFFAFSVVLGLCRPGSKGWVESILQVVAALAHLWLVSVLAVDSSPASEFLAFFAMPSAYQIPPILLLVLVGLAPLIALVPGRISGPAPSSWRRLLLPMAAYLLLLCTGAVGIGSCLDKTVRRHFLYDHLAQQGRWSDILREESLATSQPNPAGQFDAFYRTRALYHTSKLFETLIYSHPTSPVDGLAFPPSQDGETTLANGDLYFEMGAVNHAIRFATEALAVYGYSPRLLQRLAICYAAQGKIEMARSLAEILKTTIVAAAWARSFAPLLDNPEALAQNADIHRLKLLQPKSDFMAQLTSLSYEFRHIWLSGTTFNRMALEYYLASAPQLIGQYLDFMVLAGDCRAGDASSCEKCKSTFGETFWYAYFVHSPEVFDLPQPSGGNEKEAP